MENVVIRNKNGFRQFIEPKSVILDKIFNSTDSNEAGSKDRAIKLVGFFSHVMAISGHGSWSGAVSLQNDERVEKLSPVPKARSLVASGTAYQLFLA